MKTESEPVLEMPVSGGFDSDNIAFCINQFDNTAPGHQYSNPGYRHPTIIGYLLNAIQIISRGCKNQFIIITAGHQACQRYLSR